MKKIVKCIYFCGSSLDNLRTFPESIHRDVGHQLDKVQRGLIPDNWKPMKTIGMGVREVGVKDTSGVFRVIYVTKFQDHIYVLHCFHKKTQKTAKTDIELAIKHYQALKKDHSHDQ